MYITCSNNFHDLVNTVMFQELSLMYFDDCCVNVALNNSMHSISIIKEINRNY